MPEIRGLQASQVQTHPYGARSWHGRQLIEGDRRFDGHNGAHPSFAFRNGRQHLRVIRTEEAGLREQSPLDAVRVEMRKPLRQCRVVAWRIPAGHDKRRIRPEDVCVRINARSLA